MVDYGTAPHRAVCAIVDPVRNVAVWNGRKHGVATYVDQGLEFDGSIFSRPVPTIVKHLVFNKTGRRIRFACTS